MTASVSVVLPVYNGERYLAAAMRSVLDQLRPTDELIVVDDGSTDSSARVVEEVKRNCTLPIAYLYQQNQGPAAARNRGLQLAKGEFIAFQDADDLWAPGRLKLQMDLLLGEPKLDFVVGRAHFCAADGSRLQVDTNPLNLYFGLHIALYRRTAFEKVGLLDESLRFWEDLDWFLRARERGLQLLSHPDAVILHRRHQGNVTNDQLATQKGYLHLLRRQSQRTTTSAQPLLVWLQMGQETP